MRPKHSGQSKASAERVVKDIRRATRRHFSAEDKIRIVLEGLRGDASIVELCRKDACILPAFNSAMQFCNKFDCDRRLVRPPAVVSMAAHAGVHHKKFCT